jgi:predicted amidohydrolase YtcJ
MAKHIAIAGLLLGVAALSASAQRRAPAPDLIVTGGKIFTADPSKPWVQAIAIRGERIVATGDDSTIRALAGRRTRLVDVAGRTVIPGINDAHDHTGGVPYALRFRTSSSPTENPPLAQILDSLRAVVARTPAGTWITATIGTQVFMDTTARRSALDAVAPDHPVILSMYTGHGAVMNSAALRAVGVRDDVRDPLGGWYERDASNRPTGLLQEYVVWSIERSLMSRMPDTMLVRAMRDFGQASLARGITSVQDMANDLDPRTTLRVLRQAKLPIRIRVIPFSMPTTEGRQTSEWDRVDRHPSPGVVVDGRKWILEGTGIEGNALSRHAYARRPDWYGRLDFPVDTVRAILKEALATREQLMLHIVGDSSTKLVLEMMQSLAPDSAWRALRVRFEHGDAVNGELALLAKRLGVIVVQNPTHFGFQAFGSLLHMGIPIAIGSDNARNPFLNIMLAVGRQFGAAEALTREEAVTAYTRGSAYAEFQERNKGTLAPGMLADLAVLSQDIFTVPLGSLPATVSVLTMVGGKVLYDVRP